MSSQDRRPNAESIDIHGETILALGSHYPLPELPHGHEEFALLCLQRCSVDTVFLGLTRCIVPDGQCSELIFNIQFSSF